MELSNNYSSIFTGLSNYFTLTQRSYAGWRNFYLKKMKKVLSNNLTSTGYGRLCVADSLPQTGTTE